MNDAHRRQMQRFLLAKYMGALQLGTALMSPNTGVPSTEDSPRFLRIEAIRKQAHSDSRKYALK